MKNDQQAESPDRRMFLGLIAAASVFGLGEDADAASVPWSSGTELPRTKAPPGATDCHHHIYDSRFPVSAKAVLRPADATVSDYRLLEKRLGIARSVTIQPSTYGTDNRCMLDALRQFGRARGRGIAVVDGNVSNAELRQMDAAGVRGIRFNLLQAGATPLDSLEPLAKRIAVFGWHVEVNASPEQIEANQATWNRIPVNVVFDHLAHITAPAQSHPAFGTIAKLLRQGKAWMKLSGAYMDRKTGPPTYADAGLVVRAYVKEAPERLVWGTDWPHPTEKKKPDDALLLDLLAEWVPEENTRNRILVDNAAKLYGFA